MTLVDDSRQLPLFDVRQFVPQPYPAWSFYDVLEKYGELIVLRSDFPPPGPDFGGQTPWCPVLMSKLVIIQDKHGWPDRETIQRCSTDLQVKACLGLGVEQQGPSQPTVVRHRQLMSDLGLDELYERRFSNLMLALELLDRDEAVLVDSVPIRGAGQVLDTYNLLGAAIRKSLGTLARARGQSDRQVAVELDLVRYLSRSVKGSFDIDWSDDEARLGLLEQLVADARRVQQALHAQRTAPADAPARVAEANGADEADEEADEPEQPSLPGLEQDDDQDDTSSPVSPAPSGSPPEPEPPGGLTEAADLIDQILAHDVDVDEHGTVRGIVPRAAGDRPISVTDPDMRHGRKSASVLIAGFKAQVVASLLYGWILCVTVMRANRHDGKDLPALVGAVTERGLAPEWWGGDHAYGTLANHAFFEQRNASGEHTAGELVAPMPRPANGGRHTKDEFDLDFEAPALTCPQGHRIERTRWATRAGHKGWSFEFAAEVCSACPSREQCVSDKAQGKGRSVFVVPEQERLIRRHLARREEDDFEQRQAERPHVERVIAGYGQCGGKQAHRFGTRAAEFGARMSALAYNFRRLGSVAANDEEVAARLARAARAARAAPWLRIVLLVAFVLCCVRSHGAHRRTW